MIIHASTKMDISHYIQWFINRLEAGFFDKEENPKVIDRYYFEDIEEIILYTRNPQKIYKHKEYFKKYNTRLITFISMYDKFYEPSIKDKAAILERIRKCSKHFNNYFGYGPIFYTNNHNKEWHLNQFDFLCNSLHRFVKGVYIDFTINEYCKKSSKTNCYQLTEIEQKHIIKELEEIAAKYRLQVYYYKREKDFEENEIDVGLHNSCPNACEYCVSITNKKIAKDKYQVFDEKNTLLYGIISQSQKIAKVELKNELPQVTIAKTTQMSLLDLIT